MLTLALLGLILLPFADASAVEADSVWVRYYGEVGNSIAFDIEIVDDGIVVSGTKSMIEGYPPLPALWFMKFDFNGNILWQREFGDNTVEKGYGFAKTPDGGFIVSGTDWGHGRSSVYLVKTDNEGNPEWERLYASEVSSIARDVEVTADGGFVITGWFEYNDSTGQIPVESIFVMKTDSLGHLQWRQEYGTTYARDEAWSIDVLDDGYVFAGRTWSTGAGMRDALIAKIDLEGNLLWYSTHGGIYKDHIYEFQTLPDGTGFICTGKTESFGLGQLTIGDIWVLRFDENGEFMWRSVIGTPPTEFGRSIDILANGDYIVTGLTGTQYLNNQVFLGRSDPDGNFIWTWHFGEPGMDDAWCVRALPGGDFIVGGLTESMGPAPRSLLLLRVTEVGGMPLTPPFVDSTAPAFPPLQGIVADRVTAAEAMASETKRITITR